MYEVGMDFLWATKNLQNETILLPAESWKFYTVPMPIYINLVGIPKDHQKKVYIKSQPFTIFGLKGDKLDPSFLPTIRSPKKYETNC